MTLLLLVTYGAQVLLAQVVGIAIDFILLILQADISAHLIHAPMKAPEMSRNVCL